jgi:2-methylisocitrate lyase-like PEP mutase family enzyme
MDTTPDYALMRTEFRRLHQSGCFAIPNPWDLGTARYLRHLGFKAVATTSSGLAFSQGLPDAEWAVPRDVVLAHIAAIAACAGVPVNADFESGYAHEPEGVAANVGLCVQTGVAGLSIEDQTGDKGSPLYELSRAIERIKAARSAIDASGTGVLLTARSECYLTGHAEPQKESLRRLSAFADAGADVLYAPGCNQPEEIRTLVAAMSPKPVNVLMGANTGLTMAALADLGVRRVSVGSAFARAAWGAFIRAATRLAQHGSFDGLDGAIPFAELNEFFRKDCEERSSTSR